VALCGKTWSLTLRKKHRLRVFKNRVSRRIFEPKKDDVTGGWRKLHNEELRNFYSSPSKIRMIKSRRMRCVWHLALMGEEECMQDYGGNVRRKEAARKTDVGGRIIFGCILRKQDEVVWTGFIWLRMGTSGAFL
jgi:hypothetical protein